MKKSYSYVAQSGKDKCTKETYTYKDPTCQNGYSYNKKSTGNRGTDVCELKGIAHLKEDRQEGF